MKNTLKRKIRSFISGSVAGWNEIFFNFIFQIILVPVFLYNWDKKIYSLWIIFLTIKGLLALINTAHRDLIFQKILSLGVKNKKKIIRITHSSFIVFTVNYLVVCLIILFFVKSNYLGNMLNITDDMLSNLNLSLILILVPTFFIFSELYIGIISIYGFYYRYAWLSLNRIISTNLIILISIIIGANYIQTILAYVLIETLCNIIIFLNFKKIIQKKNISVYKVRFDLFLYQLKNSFIILLNYIFVYFKTTGLRLIIVFFYNPAVMLVFVITRTAANILHQGIHALARPLLPNVMDLFVKKDKNGLEKLTVYINFFLSTVIAPLTIIICFLMPIFFNYWTNYEIKYNYLLFTIFVQNIFLTSIYLQFENILRGNNLVKQTFTISLTSFVILILAIYTTNFYQDIIYIAYSLMISEIISFIMVIYFLYNLMKIKNLSWSIKSTLFSCASFFLVFSASIYFALKENQVHIYEIIFIFITLFLILIIQYRTMKPAFKKDLISSIMKIKI